jgi:hypothetical protein
LSLRSLKRNEASSPTASTFSRSFIFHISRLVANDRYAAWTASADSTARVKR